jgi:hypothetical protein
MVSLRPSRSGLLFTSSMRQRMESEAISKALSQTSWWSNTLAVSRTVSPAAAVALLGSGALPGEGAPAAG